MRTTVLMAASGLALTATAIVSTPPSQASVYADPSCAPVVTVRGAGTSTLAPGIVSTAYSANTTAGKVTFHVVRADLSRARVELVSDGATGTQTLQDLSRQTPGAVALVNGDLFHVGSDGSTPTADGPMITDGIIVKAGAGEADALAIDGGVAGLAAPRFAGAATITDTSSTSGGSNVDHVAPAVDAVGDTLLGVRSPPSGPARLTRATGGHGTTVTSHHQGKAPRSRKHTGQPTVWDCCIGR